VTVGATLGNAAVATADEFVVDKTADTAPAMGTCTGAANDCSLRQALANANAGSGLDTITFLAGLTGTIGLATGPLPITERVDIIGPGAPDIKIDGKYMNRVFNVDPVTAGTNVSISGLTVTRGSFNDDGGGIHNQDADLTLRDMVVTKNKGTEVDAVGGGIASQYGSLAIKDSVISGNSTPGGAGGIYTYLAPVSIERSTVSGNSSSASTGGAIRSYDGDLQISDSAISGNTSMMAGGAIRTRYGDIDVDHSTLAGNDSTTAGDADQISVYRAPVNLRASTLSSGGGRSLRITYNDFHLTGTTVVGGGLYDEYGGTTLKNSIIAGSGPGPDLDVDTGAIQVAFSLVKNGSPSAKVVESVPGSNIFGLDPQLGPVAMNGGLTPTMLPAPGSPVVDKGSSGASSDQRGFARPFDVPSIGNSAAPGADGADMGAVELTLAEATPASPATAVSTQSTAPVAKKKKCKKRKRHAAAAKKCKKKKKKK